MSDQDEAPGGGSNHFTSAVIPFSENTGYVGMRTNGAMPQAVTGFFVEAEYGEDEPNFHYWIKAKTGEEVRGREGEEHVAFGTDLAQFERLCAAVMQAAKFGGPATRLQDRLDGYHNTAQFEFDEETPEDCVNDLACEISGTNDVQGVQVVLSKLDPSGRTGAAVARLSGGLLDASLHLLAREFRQLRTWHDERRQALAAQAGGPRP